MDFTRMGLL